MSVFFTRKLFRVKKCRVFEQSKGPDWSKPWWKQETAQMAAEVWMAEQDREGLTLSPAFEVPEDVTEITVKVLSTGFVNPVQGIEATLLLSHNNKQSFTPYANGTFWGSVIETGKNGLPGTRGFSVSLIPSNYPTNAQVQLAVAGVVNCGVSVDFGLPETP